jgi:uncharacterized protein YjbI with pentapeptide repeats
MVSTDLQGANLSGAALFSTNFTGANLQGANLSSINPGLGPQAYASTDFSGADLRGANLRGAFLQGADFDGADLQGADLTGAYISNANFDSADLRGAILVDTIGDNTQFDLAQMQYSDWMGAYFSYANFANANLSDALLGVYAWPAPGGGRLGEASFTLDSAGWTCGTILPDGSTDNGDCSYAAQVFSQLLSEVAESVSGEAAFFDPAAALAAPSVQALESFGVTVGSPLKTAFDALFSDAASGGFGSVLRSLLPGGSATSSVTSLITSMTIKGVKIAWSIEAPKVEAFFTPLETQLESTFDPQPAYPGGPKPTPPSPPAQLALDPFQAYLNTWADTLYAWMNSQPGPAFGSYVLPNPELQTVVAQTSTNDTTTPGFYLPIVLTPPTMTECASAPISDVPAIPSC